MYTGSDYLYPSWTVISQGTREKKCNLKGAMKLAGVLFNFLRYFSDFFILYDNSEGTAFEELF
jgi:hypothetical protein